MNSEQQYIRLFQEMREAIDSHSSPAMNAQRSEAFERFAATGFPSRKAERYRYTDIDALFAPDYGINLNRLAIPVNTKDVFSCNVPNLSTRLYFMANDEFFRSDRQEVSSTSTLSSPQKGEIVVGSLRELTKSGSTLADRLTECYNRLAVSDADGVTALNTMLAQDGLAVYVPRGVHAEGTIQVINLLRSDVDLMVNRRVLIVVEEDAEARLLLCDHAIDDHRFLATQVTEAFVGEHAHLDLYCMEETHAKSTRVSNVYIRQEAGSLLRHNIITLHNGTTRNMLRIDLAGEGAECQSCGCVIADKQQHADNNTLITHHAPHCTSNQLYKYVLDGEATGAFAGRVLVKPGAQKTSSQMTNQNLTATDKARMYTQPMLEIYADDVKCAHGSTVGQLNDAAMFYMQQRGISRKEARMLLENAFVGEVIDRIELAPLRDRLHYLVEKRLRGELQKCEGCNMCR